MMQHKYVHRRYCVDIYFHSYMEDQRPTLQTLTDCQLLLHIIHTFKHKLAHTDYNKQML